MRRLWAAAAAGLLGAALLPRRPLQARAILRITRVVADLERAVAFYRDRLDFTVVERGALDPDSLAALGMSGAQNAQVLLQLGEQQMALGRFSEPGRPYPPHSRSDDRWFQHLAIVVRDIDTAVARLRQTGALVAITDGSAPRLPAANGGVRAFKFRDPDGHPLELLWFPPGQGRAVWHRPPGPLFLGIDHTALSVASIPRSLGFYRTLGFAVRARSWNHGPAQDRLDGLSLARVRVIGLAAGANAPGLELLGYRPPGRPAPSPRPNDLLTDWVTLAVAGGGSRGLRDPDGHLLVLVNQGAGSSGAPA